MGKKSYSEKSNLYVWGKLIESGEIGVHFYFSAFVVVGSLMINYLVRSYSSSYMEILSWMLRGENISLLCHSDMGIYFRNVNRAVP